MVLSIAKFVTRHGGKSRVADPRERSGKIRGSGGVYPKLTVKGRPANFGPEWFKTFEEARVHILDLAAYIFEEELRIGAA